MSAHSRIRAGVRPLVTSAGSVVLMCDEGGEVWLHSDDVSRQTAIVPSHPNWRVADGIHVVPGNDQVGRPQRPRNVWSRTGVANLTEQRRV